MILHDKGLVAVDPHRTWPDDPSAVGIPASRVAEYRKLLGDLRIRGRVAVSDVRAKIEIVSSFRGVATHNSQKGYIYTLFPAEGPLVPDLDPLSSSGVGSGLRRIDDENWYLFFEGY